MDHRLRVAIAQTARMAADADHSRSRKGLVTSYDPQTYAVKVALQPDGTETGWLPLRTQWAGPGWGLFCPPPIGAQVSVEFQEGDREAGEATGVTFNDADRPLAVPAGEFWLVHSAGAFLKFTNDGQVTLNSTAGIGLIGPTKITGTLEVTGKVTADAGLAVTGGSTTDTLTSTSTTSLGGGTQSPVKNVAGTAAHVTAS